MLLDRSLAVLDAPSNLGLRPPGAGLVPGCYKAPGVFRDAGLIRRLDAHDAGVITPGRYQPGWAAGDIRNETAIAKHSLELAERIMSLRSGGDLATPVVLGGDCSILVGVGAALQRVGRFGLVSFDGLDYRHPGNSHDAGIAVGGESLAIVTGLGGGELARLNGEREPYLRSSDVVAIGLRPGDECAAEASSNGLHLIDAPMVTRNTRAAAEEARHLVERPELDGFWVHIDADVLDPEVMPAVDSPEPGGLDFDHLTDALHILFEAPSLVGVDVTIYDPELDPGRVSGHRLTDMLVRVLARG